MAALLTDVVIIILLIGGIVFAYVVNERVKTLMAILRELEPAVNDFVLAVDKSEESVAKMQKSIADRKSLDITSQEDTQSPQFATRRRHGESRETGVKIVRNKQDLVRKFFELQHRENRI